MIGNERAVSSALSYTLVTVISLSLIAGLVVGSEALVNDQRQRTAQEQVDTVGQRLASTIMAADRMSERDPGAEAAIARDLPERVVGAQYLIRVTRSAGRANYGSVRVEARETGASAAVPIRLGHATIETTRLSGGPVRVVYDDGSATVGVEDA
jgi:Na+-transporting NADH:ubiquinone oxidoreductase subunit NqrC